MRLTRLLPLALTALTMTAGLSAGLSARADDRGQVSAPEIVEVVRYARRGEYTVEQTVWIDGKTVADPERLADEVTGTSPETGTVGAQYRINSHHWDAFAMPVAVYYNPAERGNTPDAAAAIQAAIQKWNAVSPSSFSFAWAGVGDGLPGACNPEAEAVADGKNTIAFSTRLATGILGTTCTLFKGPNAPIEEFDMELDSRTPWSAASVTPVGMYDIYSTILHEMGHAAGIGHPCNTSSSFCTDAEKASVMWAFLDDGEQKRNLTGDDEDALRAQYPNGPPTPPTPTPIVVPPFSRDFQAIAISLARD